MLRLEPTSRFRRDVRRMYRRGYDLSLLNDVLECLAHEKSLDARHHDHPLAGDWQGCRECHIRPDWLLIYQIDRNRLVLIEQRTGTHADLFDE